MNKTAIKNFSIWARKKLIADIQYRAGLMGITAEEIKTRLPQSTEETEFYDIGTAEPYALTGEAIKQRRSLVEVIERKAKETNYKTAYKYIIEGVAYTWFNRLIAVRFMEINDYLPSHIRVLSSDSGKMEPDLVTTPFDAEIPFTDTEKQTIIQLKNDNNLDECFRILFIKQCNALNDILPALFEKTSDYTELLLNISAIDKDGVVCHLVNDIPEDDFNIEKGGQVEIIGWLYQYYNTEPKNEAFAKSGKISKEEIPAVTQLFTPDWIVRYMVENSLGRLWVEGHPNDLLKSKWKYYLEEAEQEPEVQAKLEEMRKEYAKLNPEDIHFIDPCMGSGHILVYAFDVLMQIYESAGYTERDAAKSILENNLYGLDIDDRAYQMAYFAVMMKARQYNRRILSSDAVCHVYSIQESNSVNRNQLQYFGTGLSEIGKNDAMNQITGLLDTFKDAKEYGSILNVRDYNWELLRRFINDTNVEGQMTLDAVGLLETQERLGLFIDIGEVMAKKYEVVVTNPPYMGNAGMDVALSTYLFDNYPDSKADFFTVFIEKSLRMICKSGIFSMITQYAWTYKTTFSGFREKMLSSQIINMIHLGTGAFADISGEIVNTTAFVGIKKECSNYISTFSRLIDYPDEDKKRKGYLSKNSLFYTKQDRFKEIAEYIYAYWISEKVFSILSTAPSVSNIAFARKGLTTGDNDRFVRTWFEISRVKMNDNHINGHKWFPMTKGGQYRKWYGNNDYVINWENDGFELKHFTDDRGKQKSVIRNPDFYFHECISWNDTGSGDLSFRYQNDSFIPNASGPCVYSGEVSIDYLVALFNSKISRVFMQVLSPALKFEVGSIAQYPVIYSKEGDSIIQRYSNLCIMLSKNEWDSYENSWDFNVHPLTGGKRMGRLIVDKYKEWKAECDNRFNQLKANEEELNRIFIDIYGLQDELTPEVEDKDVTVRKADLQRDIKSLVSYAVGCMFGRYSVDREGLIYAGGDIEEVFEKKKNSKGYEFYYLRGNDGKDTFAVDIDNIIPITDEEYLEDDIVALFCEWVKKVYGVQTLEQNLDFIAAALGNKGDTSRDIIRNYFLNDFFKDHCQTYSVTGSGKRPIYWLFDSGKQNGFKALIYLHRYNADTVGNLRVDYLHRMQRVYESEIGRMQDTIDHSTNSREVGAATKRKEKLQKQLKECRDYDEKIGHLALSRTELDLDDGVKVNYRKLQTASDGKFYEVLADSKNIMAKSK